MRCKFFAMRASRSSSNWESTPTWRVESGVWKVAFDDILLRSSFFSVVVVYVVCAVALNRERLAIFLAGKKKCSVLFRVFISRRTKKLILGKRYLLLLYNKRAAKNERVLCVVRVRIIIFTNQKR